MKNMTKFIKKKMEDTFLKKFTNPEAKWDSDHITFDQNHSCTTFIVTKRNVFSITSCEGDPDTIIRFVQSWFREYNIPYIILYKKKLYNPFPETDYLLHYHQEMLSLKYKDLYENETLFLINLENRCIDIYYEKIDHENKLGSVSEHNFEEWKKEVVEEKEKIKPFQDTLNNHTAAFPIMDNEKITIKKTWMQGGWEYVTHVYRQTFFEKEITEELLENVLSCYNKNYATETIFMKILTETKKMDPYMFVKRRYRGGEHDTICAFGTSFSYRRGIDDNPESILIKLENIEVSIPNTSCLLEEELNHYVQTLLKPIKGARLASVLKEKNTGEDEEEQAVLSLLQAYFDVGRNKKTKIVSEVDSKQEVYKELWDYFKKHSRQDIIHINELSRKSFRTKSFIITMLTSSEFLFTYKNKG